MWMKKYKCILEAKSVKTEEDPAYKIKNGAGTRKKARLKGEKTHENLQVGGWKMKNIPLLQGKILITPPAHWLLNPSPGLGQKHLLSGFLSGCSNIFFGMVN